MNTNKRQIKFIDKNEVNLQIQMMDEQSQLTNKDNWQTKEIDRQLLSCYRDWKDDIKWNAFLFPQTVLQLFQSVQRMKQS